MNPGMVVRFCFPTTGSEAFLSYFSFIEYIGYVQVLLMCDIFALDQTTKLKIHGSRVAKSRDRSVWIDICYLKNIIEMHSSLMPCSVSYDDIEKVFGWPFIRYFMNETIHEVKYFWCLE